MSALPGELGSGLSNLERATVVTFVLGTDSYMIFYYLSALK
jgi:hypothetical protein